MSISNRFKFGWIWLLCLTLGYLSAQTNSYDPEQRIKLNLNGIPHNVHVAISTPIKPLKLNILPLELKPISIDRSVFTNSALLATTASGLFLFLGSFVLPSKNVHSSRLVMGLIGWILTYSSIKKLRSTESNT